MGEKQLHKLLQSVTAATKELNAYNKVTEILRKQKPHIKDAMSKKIINEEASTSVKIEHP